MQKWKWIETIFFFREYLDHPRLKATAIDTSDGNMDTQDKVSAAYVPAHLHHIMFEILKVTSKESWSRFFLKGNTSIVNCARTGSMPLSISAYQIKKLQHEL